MTAQPVRSKRMERLTLNILTEAMRQATGWKVHWRDDQQDFLEIGIEDAETHERTVIANIRVVAWDMTGGLIDEEDGVKEYKLHLFDLDGTLAPMDGDQLYPDAQKWMDDHKQSPWMVVSNQGGIGLRHWMEVNAFGDPTPYPTLAEFERRLERLFPEIPANEQHLHILFCVRYQSKKSGAWCPVPSWGAGHPMWREDWRKPSPGMLIHAMAEQGCSPADTLMVGDSIEDQQAAAAAGCDFMWAWQFFGREKPEE